MLGFTHNEARTYLDTIFTTNNFDEGMKEEIWQLLINNYNGYHFLPNAEPIFNSTILTYFLQDFVYDDATIPIELIDENLRTDVSWLTRLAQSNERAIANIEGILQTGGIEYSTSDLKSSFGKDKFTNPEFFPISLFYLGMTTLANNYQMILPNLTMKSIFTGYYNNLSQLRGLNNDYVPYFLQFSKDFKIEGLVECYCKKYLGLFAAQSFDKINENFMRNTFYELCNRYLSGDFLLGMEQNYPSGRSDFEISGRQGTAFHHIRYVVEMKYYPNKMWSKMKALKEPYEEHVTQVEAYAQDARNLLTEYTIRPSVIYIIGNKGWKCWEI